MKLDMKGKAGVALILAVGILALLTVIATTFALNMRLEYKAAVNYYNQVNAHYLAEAAIEKAMATIKDDAKSTAIDTWKEGWTSGSFPISSTGEWIAKDEQSRVNINNANVQLLVNLCSIISGVTGGDGSTVFGSRPGDGYNQKDEILNIPNWNCEKYDAIKGSITCHSYVDNNTARSPININTASTEILRAVFQNLTNVGGNGLPGPIGISPTQSSALVTEIVNRRGATPFTSWADFEDFIDNDGNVNTALSGSDDLKTIVKHNCNPNRQPKPTGMTTELCFHGGGVFEIKATGTADDGTSETITAIVKIYEIYNDTSFATGAGPSGTGLDRATTEDSCPINADYLFENAYSPSGTAITAAGSVKLGYWAEDNADLIANPPTGDWGRIRLRGEVDTSAAGFADAGHIEFWYDGAAGDPYQRPHFLITNSSTERVGVKTACREYVNQSGYGDFVMTTEHETGYGMEKITFAEPDGNQYVPYPFYPAPALWVWPNSLNTSYPDGWNDSAQQPHQYYWPLTSGTDKRVIQIDASDQSPTITFDVFEETGYGTAGTPSHTFTYTDADKPSGRHGEVRYPTGAATWREERIIPEEGSYTSIVIDDSVIPYADFEWGTITATVTQTTDTGPDQGDFYLQIDTDSAGDVLSNNIDAMEDFDDVGVDDELPYLNFKDEELYASDGTTVTANVIHAPLGSNSKWLQYKAFMKVNMANWQHAPVLEDVTITYLPAVEILSYTQSQ